MTVSTDIRRGLIYAGLIIVVAGGAKVGAAHGLVGSDWPGRAMMAVVGLFLMTTGNAIPKTLMPLSASACNSATLQRLQRRAGWTFALAGACDLPVSLEAPIVFYCSSHVCRHQRVDGREPADGIGRAGVGWLGRSTRHENTTGPEEPIVAAAESMVRKNLVVPDQLLD